MKQQRNCAKPPAEQKQEGKNGTCRPRHKKDPLPVESCCRIDDNGLNEKEPWKEQRKGNERNADFVCGSKQLPLCLHRNFSGSILLFQVGAPQKLDVNTATCRHCEKLGKTKVG